MGSWRKAALWAVGLYFLIIESGRGLKMLPDTTMATYLGKLFGALIIASLAYGLKALVLWGYRKMTGERRPYIGIARSGDQETL